MLIILVLDYLVIVYSFDSPRKKQLYKNSL